MMANDRIHILVDGMRQDHKMTDLPKLCKDCKHSKPESPNSEVFIRCYHPKVNRHDSWALSNGRGDGTNCHNERSKKSLWFYQCGMPGLLWEAK